MRRECQPDQAVGLPLHDTRIDWDEMIFGNPIDFQAGRHVPPRQADVSRSFLSRPLSDSHEEDDFVIRADDARIENTNNVEVAP
jgi:hypothetical protein